jgi:hypothetical protein
MKNKRSTRFFPSEVKLSEREIPSFSVDFASMTTIADPYLQQVRLVLGEVRRASDGTLEKQEKVDIVMNPGSALIIGEFLTDQVRKSFPGIADHVKRAKR